MIIVSSPAANIPPDVVRQYGIVLSPGYIVRDGVSVHTDELPTHDDVDKLVRTAKTHPHSLGASSAEMVSLFRELGNRENEIIFVAPSRMMTGAYDAGVAAARTLQTLPKHRDVKVSVVDSATADLGTALIAVFCAEAAKAGMPRTQIVEAAEALAAQGILGCIPMNFDYLAKSGRASFLKTMLATLFQKLPHLGLMGGELKPIGTIDKHASLPASIHEQLVKDLGQGRRIWTAVTHGHNPDGAAELTRLIRQSFDVAYLLESPLSAGVYINAGPSLAVMAYPTDVMRWPLTPS